MKFGVIIVTYNRLALLKECVSCVLSQTEPFSNICIVDNHSSDGLKTCRPHFRLKPAPVVHLFLISAVLRKIWEAQEALLME